MNTILFNAILATLVLSSLSLAGVVTLGIKASLLQRASLYLVAFSAGALVGGAFFHLLPEALELSSELIPFVYLILGISIFFVMERYLKWHHCHDEGECEAHTFTHMSLFGDGLHNFIDGLVIVSAFAISTELGVVTTIAIAAHELPQELGDFGILVYGGFTRGRALLWNFISSATAIVGAVLGYFLINYFASITAVLLPIAAGGFIYIAMTDLVPELHKEPKISKSLLNFVLFALGIIFMLGMKVYIGG